MILSEAIEKLNELEKAAYALGHAQSILFVDGDTVAPKNSWKGRGKALSYVGELMYRQLVNPETGEVLETILQHKDETDEVTFRRAEVMKESYDDLHILPMEEFIAYQELTNESSAVWHDAKEKSDWNMFAPYLEKLIANFYGGQSDSYSTDEFITMVEEANEDGDIEDHEADLITNALEFNDLDVGEILTPRKLYINVAYEFSSKVLMSAFIILVICRNT